MFDFLGFACFLFLLGASKLCSQCISWLEVLYNIPGIIRVCAAQEKNTLSFEFPQEEVNSNSAHLAREGEYTRTQVNRSRLSRVFAKRLGMGSRQQLMLREPNSVLFDCTEKALKHLLALIPYHLGAYQGEYKTHTCQRTASNTDLNSWWSQISLMSLPYNNVTSYGCKMRCIDSTRLGRSGTLPNWWEENQSERCT